MSLMARDGIFDELREFGEVVTRHLAEIRDELRDQETDTETIERAFSLDEYVTADGAAQAVVELEPTTGEGWKVEGVAVKADTAAARVVELYLGDPRTPGARPLGTLTTDNTAGGIAGPLGNPFPLPEGLSLFARFPAAIAAGQRVSVHVWGTYTTELAHRD